MTASNEQQGPGHEKSHSLAVDASLTGAGKDGLQSAIALEL